MFVSYCQIQIGLADGYKRNPPIQMDPFRGALALDASLQVIANSGTH